MKTRAEIITIILTTFANLTYRRKPGGQSVLGCRYIIGRTAKNEAIALIYDPEDRNELTSEILEEIKVEATQAGLAKPIHVYAAVNGGPNGSPSYHFQQLTEALTGPAPSLPKVPEHNESKMLSCIAAAIRAAKRDYCSYIVAQRRNSSCYNGIYEVKPRREFNGSDLVTREHVEVSFCGQVNYQQKTDAGWKTICLQTASQKVYRIKGNLSKS